MLAGFKLKTNLSFKNKKKKKGRWVLLGARPE
jgi:hypothetical protein